MVANGAAEPSMVSSQGSYSATDLSRRTDRSGISLPDDGRSVTIPTSRRKRREGETTSTLSHGTNTSLLIEYFENGKPAGSSGHRPSVRVKVTPSAAKRHNIKPNADGQGLQISDAGGRPDSRQGRRPSHTHRISLAPYKHNVENEDRVVLGEARRGVRSRSQSGDHSTLSSYTSGGTDSNVGNGPLNVTVIREAGSPGSMISSPRDINGESIYKDRRRRARTSSRNAAADNYYEEGGLKTPKGLRSRSVSRGSDISMEGVGAKAPKLGRRRSRSLSRERVSMSQEDREKIERGVRAELEKLKNPKTRKQRGSSKAYDDGGLKPPRVRNRSRSPERELDEIAREKLRNHRRKESGQSVRSVSGGSAIANNPALVELIQDTIKKLVLPEIEEMKSQQKAQSKIPPILASGAVPDQYTKRPGKSNSMPDVGGPAVVLSADKSLGQGLSGSNRNNKELDLERDGEGVSLVGSMGPANGGEEITQRLEMPDGPFRSDTPGTNAGTRASILTANSGLPYPKTSSGMPSSGTTPPPAPRSEYPELSELNLHSVVGGDSSVLSEGTADPKSMVSRTGLGMPSIASLNLGSDINDDDDRASGTSSATRQAPTTVGPAPSDLSFASMSVDQASTVLAKERKGRRRTKAEMPHIHEGSNQGGGSAKASNPVDMFLAEQREREQERALMNPNMQDRSLEVRHVATVSDGDVEPRPLPKVADGQHVFALGANPSMRSTPDLAHSVQPSVVDPSMIDGGGSALSYDRPHLGANANPLAGSPMQDLTHHIAEEDEDINTNPSIIQGPIGHQPANWEQYNAPHSQHDLGISGDRGLNIGVPRAADSRTRMGATPDLDPHGAITPPLKDEGYISAANAMGSPGPVSPVQGMRQMGGIDDMLDDGDDDEFSPYRGQRSGMGSGTSHGMPSPLYDSATGRGIERIESKDIVALMEHLTVRDAQRNARDTEILVTLVRSAAEMRNSFEDMRRHLEASERNIIDGVDQNTERSVQKIIQGPRPLPPSAPRRPRYQGSEEDADAEGSAKRRNVFKRALKGLSMRSSNDLQRIEEMLCQLLNDVEGLKGGQQFYQHSLMQSQSMGALDHLKSMEDSQGSQEPAQINAFLTNPAYQTGEPSQQPVQKMPQGEDAKQPDPMSSINEDEILATPTHTNMRGVSLPIETPPDSKVPLANASFENTPTKSSDRGNPTTNKRESNSSSIFPKFSRWSETTASSGLRNFLSKKKDQNGSDASNSRSDFNFWEAEEKNHQANQAIGSPFASDGQRTDMPNSPREPQSPQGVDAPLNHSSRRSLDIQHPQPRQPYNGRLEMEAQAQQLAAQGIMINNNSTSTLGNFPPLGPGGRMQNGQYMSPLAQDAYNKHLEQQQQSLNAAAAAVAAAQPPPALPPKIKEEEPEESDHSRRKERKHRERDENGERIRKPKKERTEEEKQRRRERKERRERERESGSSSSRKKSRDMLSPDEGPSVSGRTLSSASRLNGPRPLSSNSNRESSRRHRHMSSQSTNDTFGNGYDNDSYGNHR